METSNPILSSFTTDRKYHYTKNYAKRMKIENDDSMYDDVLRVAERFLSETERSRRHVRNILDSARTKQTDDKMAQCLNHATMHVYEILEEMSLMISRLTRNTHYLVILEQNDRLYEFKHWFTFTKMREFFDDIEVIILSLIHI